MSGMTCKRAKTTTKTQVGREFCLKFGRFPHLFLGLNHREMAHFSMISLSPFKFSSVQAQEVVEHGQRCAAALLHVLLAG